MSGNVPEPTSKVPLEDGGYTIKASIVARLSELDPEHRTTKGYWDNKALFMLWRDLRAVYNLILKQQRLLAYHRRLRTHWKAKRGDLADELEGVLEDINTNTVSSVDARTLERVIDNLRSET